MVEIFPRAPRHVHELASVTLALARRPGSLTWLIDTMKQPLAPAYCVPLRPGVIVMA